MSKVKFVILVFTITFAAFYSATAQNVTKANSAAPAPALKVVDLTGKEHVPDLSGLKRVTVKASDHGKDATFEGVSLMEVLKLAGVEFGEALRGKRLTEYLLVEAADGYKA